MKAGLSALVCLGAISLGALGLRAEVPGADETFDACEAQMRQLEGHWNACGCLYSLAEGGFVEESEKRLEALLADGRRELCARFNLGRLGLLLARPEAIDLLQQVGDDFAAAGEAEAETWARINASRAARRAGDPEQAARQCELAAASAARAGEPALEAQVELQSIRLSLAAGGDLEEIGARLAALEESSSGFESPTHWRDLLQARGNTAYLLGRFDEAAHFYRRMAEHCRESGLGYGEATALLNGVIAKSATELGPGDRDLLRSWIEEALDAAVEAGQLEAEAEARLRLALVTRTATDRRRDVVSQLERSIELARELGAGSIESRALAALAREKLDEDPARARELLEASEAAARASPHFGVETYGWADRLEVAWRLSDLDEATAYGQGMLTQVEEHRRRQRADGGRAEVFAVWSEIYYALAGRLLAEAERREGEERRWVLAEALGVVESLRARVLLESIALEPEGAGIFEAASLEVIQHSLAEQEALLSFQVAGWESVYGGFPGGAWLSVVTASALRVYRLPGRRQLASAVRLYAQLVAKRDGSDASAARRLHRDVLEQALADLPAEVEHLVIVADGPLHRLPFARLLDGDGEPLSERFALSWAPSATFRAGLAGGGSAPAGAALILADPALPGGVDLPPLPGARSEATRIRRAFAGRILEGAEASERSVAELDLEPFNIVHFAAHAVIDEADPEQSYIVLAAGGGGDDTEDGLLRAPEIAELALDGRLVVLAACRGGGGRVLAGEGPMSLARAFFQAGARTVVASLWPLRDDEAARLFEDFYAALARGRDAASALAHAQAESRRRGEPAAAWAGLVVLGDGAATYEPRLPPLERWILRIISALVVLSMVVAGGSLLWLYLKSSTGFRSPWSSK